MSNDEVLAADPGPAILAGEPGQRPATILDALRAQHERVTAANTVKVLIAGYKQPYLAAEYRLLDTEASKALGKAVQDAFKDESDRLLYGSIDVLVDALQGFYVGEQLPDLAPLTDDGAPVTNWGHLAELLGHETAGARDAVVAVFMQNPNSAVAHSQTVQRWMNDTSIGVDEAFLGEA